MKTIENYFNNQQVRQVNSQQVTTTAKTTPYTFTLSPELIDGLNPKSLDTLEILVRLTHKLFLLVEEYAQTSSTTIDWGVSWILFCTKLVNPDIKITAPLDNDYKKFLNIINQYESLATNLCQLIKKVDLRSYSHTREFKQILILGHVLQHHSTEHFAESMFRAYNQLKFGLNGVWMMPIFGNGSVKELQSMVQIEGDVLRFVGANLRDNLEICIGPKECPKEILHLHQHIWTQVKKINSGIPLEYQITSEELKLILYYVEKMNENRFNGLNDMHSDNLYSNLELYDVYSNKVLSDGLCPGILLSKNDYPFLHSVYVYKNSDGELCILIKPNVSNQAVGNFKDKYPVVKSGAEKIAKTCGVEIILPSICKPSLLTQEQISATQAKRKVTYSEQSHARFNGSPRAKVKLQVHKSRKGSNIDYALNIEGFVPIVIYPRGRDKLMQRSSSTERYKLLYVSDYRGESLDNIDFTNENTWTREKRLELVRKILDVFLAIPLNEMFHDIKLANTALDGEGVVHLIDLVKRVSTYTTCSIFPVDDNNGGQVFYKIINGHGIATKCIQLSLPDWYNQAMLGVVYMIYQILNPIAITDETISWALVWNNLIKVAERDLGRSLSGFCSDGALNRLLLDAYCERLTPGRLQEFRDGI